ncbi:MAG: hypothetical protein ACFFDT_13280, partial [Candidatus Hodarchaeota archaeon]
MTEWTIPLRMRYALFLGVIIGTILTIGLFQLKPAPTLPVTSLEAQTTNDFNRSPIQEVLLPPVTTGHRLELQLWFPIIKSANYTLTISFYIIEQYFSSGEIRLGTVGVERQWNITNSTDTSKIVRLIFPLQQNGQYLLRIKESAPRERGIMWMMILTLSGQDNVTPRVLHFYYLLNLTLSLLILPQFLEDILKTYFQKEGKQAPPRKLYSSKDMLSVFTPMISSSKRSPRSLSSLTASLRLFFRLLYKRSFLVMLLIPFFMLSFSLGYVLPCILYQQENYYPYTPMTIHLALTGLNIRLLVILL